MENGVIKNETRVYYTVKVGSDLFVENVNRASKEIMDVTVTKYSDYAEQYHDLNFAKQISEFVGGEVIKNTVTEIVTKSTEILKEVN